MTDSDTSSVKSTTSDPISIISAPLPQALHFPTLFNDSFGPSALLYAALTLMTTMTYSEGSIPTGSSDDQFCISRPILEVPLNVLFKDDCSGDGNWASAINMAPSRPSNEHLNGSVEKEPEFDPSPSPENTLPVSAAGQHRQDVIMLPTSDHSFTQHPVSITPPLPVDCPNSSFSTEIYFEPRLLDNEEDNECSPAPSTARRISIFNNLAPISTLRLSLLPACILSMGLARALQTHPVRPSRPNSRDDDDSALGGYPHETF